MQEIHVFIKRSITTGTDEITVDQDPVAIHSGHPMIWHFHNCLTSTVKWAQIEFQGATAKGPAAKGSDPPEFFKCRQDGKGTFSTIVRGTDVGTGNGSVMGTTPSLGKRGATQVKYTVKGYDMQGGKEVVAALDPEIIIEDP